MNRFFSLLLMLFLSIHVLNAQVGVPNEAELINELNKRGISEADFRERMSEKGFDVDNFDPLEFPEFERAAEQAVRELEAELQKEELAEIEAAVDTLKNEEEKVEETAAEQVADASAERIKQLVDEGVPLEEAIARELNEQSQQELPPAVIYGQHIFRNKDIAAFTPSEDIRPPANYVLGAGDKITIVIWGASHENATFEINKSGYIQPTDMGRINLKGITYQKAKELLRSRYGEYYRFRPEEFEVTIDYARTITVNILGEAMNAGSFNIPALNTAFNALAVAGGPSNIGSVRNINLIHSNGQNQKVDLYKFLLDPTVVKDFFMQNNDYLFIPVAEKVVKIDGAINRPFFYELLDSEGLNKLIEYAGGLKENAYLSNVQVKRFTNDEEVIVDVNLRELQSSGRDFSLQKGDEVFIKSIPNTYENFVSVEGAVDLPGRYEILRGMRVADLLKQSELSKDAKTDIAYLQRLNPDNTIKYIRLNLDEIIENPNSDNNEIIEDEDRLVIFSQTKFTDEQRFAIQGAVRNPGNHPFDPGKNLKVEDAVIIAGGLTDMATDFAYVYRKDPQSKKLTEYVRINIKEAVNNTSSVENITLQPYDSLVIYDFRNYLENAYVKVNGAVRNPREFKYDESLSIKDALTLAGGLKLSAATSRIDISRIVMEDNNQTQTEMYTVEVDEDYNVINGEISKLMPFDMIYVRKAPEFELQQNITIKGEVKYPGTYPITSDNEQITSFINRSGGLTKEAFAEGATLYRVKDGVGYVVMSLDEAMENNKSIHNFILKDGDIIEIPKQKDFVSIKGATKVREIYPDKIIRGGRVNVPHHKSKNAKWYVDEYAAGIGEDGRNRLITVEHPNGKIEKTRNYILFKSYPSVEKGSVITVGKIVKTERDLQKEREDVDWGKVVADAVAQATAILSLILIAQNVN